MPYEECVKGVIVKVVDGAGGVPDGLVGVIVGPSKEYPQCVEVADLDDGSLWEIHHTDIEVHIAEIESRP